MVKRNMKCGNGSSTKLTTLSGDPGLDLLTILACRGSCETGLSLCMAKELPSPTVHDQLMWFWRGTEAFGPV